MKTLLILWTVAFAATVQTQNPPDCNLLENIPWFVNNPVNCRAYWVCTNRDAAPIADECGVGFHFDEDNQSCNFPDAFPCQEPGDPEPTDPVPTAPEPTTTPNPEPTPPPNRNICEGLPDGRLVNNPTLCRSYFECINEIALPRQCPVGLNFNEVFQLCDRPSFTPCSNDDFECPFYGISRWEVPGSCTEYNYCFGGQRRVQECAPGLTFDSNIGLCALQENVNCTRDLCPVNNDIDDVWTYPSDEDCEQYYKCYDGNRELQFCAPGTHWNQDRERCERPEDAECELPTEPTEPPTEPTEPTEPSTEPPTEPTTVEPPFCDDRHEPFNLPHPADCQKYFICSGGVPFERRCVDGLLFDALLESCNFAEHVVCAENSVRRTKRKNYFMDHIVRRI